MTNVQGLMGNQLRDLKLFENDPVIQTWVNRQLQSDLDKLALNLTTNRPDLTTAPPSTNDATASETQGKNAYHMCLLSDCRLGAQT